MATAAKKQETITISPPRFRTIEVLLKGTAPLVTASFPSKVRQQLREKMEAGSTAKKGAKREARDFAQDLEQAKHISTEGWVGVPAAAFRNACIDACRMCGFKMTHAKMSVFIEADGFDVQDNTPLVKILEGELQPLEKSIMPVRNATGVVDLRARPMWINWKILLRVKFDEDQFSAGDVINLLARAGVQVGIGEGRPFSKSGNGLGWGTFVLAE